MNPFSKNPTLLAAVVTMCGAFGMAATNEPQAKREVSGMTVSNAPRLICDAPVYDYGRVENTRQMEHVFPLRNEGSAPLTFTRVHTGCGCTKATLSSMTIPPGDTGAVTVVFSLRGRTGDRYMNVYLHSNDPAAPVFHARCIGSTFAVPVVPPSPMPPGPAAPVAPASRMPWASAARSGPTSGVSQPAGLPARPARPEAGGSAWLSSFSSNSQRPAAGAPVLAPPVSADMTVAPGEVVLEDNGGSLLRARYVVLRTDGRPFRVLGLDSGLPEGAVSVYRSGPGWCHLKIGPLSKPAVWQDTVLEVRTDLQGAETLCIPIRRVVAQTPSGAVGQQQR